MAWIHAIATFLGLTNPAGSWYAAWSGVGSDISELAIIAAVVGFYHKHNCHVDGCRRIGRLGIHGTPWVVCHKHHPTGPPTEADIKALSPNGKT